VQFRYGIEDVNGVVTEDRGPIGVRGRRLYLIRFSAGPGYESEVELPADQLRVLHDVLR
jgi:hypothetical protein